MSNFISIEPFTQTVTNIITSFTANITNIQLFVSANISVNLYSADPRLINTVDLPLFGADYDNWANDDQYIIDYVLNKLGFVIAPEPPTDPELTGFHGFHGQPVYTVAPVVPDVSNQPN